MVIVDVRMVMDSNGALHYETEVHELREVPRDVPSSCTSTRHPCITRLPSALYRSTINIKAQLRERKNNEIHRPKDLTAAFCCCTAPSYAARPNDLAHPVPPQMTITFRSLSLLGAKPRQQIVDLTCNHIRHPHDLQD